MKKERRALSDATIKTDADGAIRFDQCEKHYHIIDDFQHWIAADAVDALKPHTLVVVISKVFFFCVF